MKLSWTAPAIDDMIGYNVYKDGGLIAEEITETEYMDMDLTPGTYEYEVCAVYDEGTSDMAGPVTVTVPGGEYCIPGADCSFGDGFTDFMFAGIENLESGCSPGGYGDFTDLEGTAEIGFVYTATFATGYADQFVSMWVDFDDNYVFEVHERILTDFDLGTANVLTEVDILIPGSALPGNHRMRIGSNWTEISSPDPCAILTYGEWEDYTLEITGTPVSYDALTIDIMLDETMPSGDVVPMAMVKNNGVETVTFPVTCTAGDYSSTITVTDLALGEEVEVTFDAWAAAAGPYTVEVCTELSGDEIPDNDCMSVDVNVLTYDVGLVSIDMASTMMLGDVTPKATVMNYGFETVTFPVTMTIEDADYTSTTEVANLAPGQVVQIEFDNWTNSLGQHLVTACTELSGDENLVNDCAETLVTVSEDARQKVIMEIATGTW